MLIRFAVSRNFHCDTSHLANRNSLKTEVQRRIWWQICLIDSRSQTSKDSRYKLTERSFDTLMPTNIDDIALDSLTLNTPPYHRQMDRHHALPRPLRNLEALPTPPISKPKQRHLINHPSRKPRSPPTIPHQNPTNLPQASQPNHPPSYFHLNKHPPLLRQTRPHSPLLSQPTQTTTPYTYLSPRHTISRFSLNNHPYPRPPALPRMGTLPLATLQSRQPAMARPSPCTGPLVCGACLDIDLRGGVVNCS